MTQEPDTPQLHDRMNSCVKVPSDFGSDGRLTWHATKMLAMILSTEQFYEPPDRRLSMTYRKLAECIDLIRWKPFMKALRLLESCGYLTILPSDESVVSVELKPEWIFRDDEEPPQAKHRGLRWRIS